MSDELIAQLPDLLPRLRRFAIGLSGSRDAGDDLLQAACERALTKRHQWTPGTRLDSWMYRIIQTLWSSEQRRRRAQGESVSADVLDCLPAHGGRDVADVLLTLDEALHALSLLSEEHRIVMLLVGVEGFTYKEAAETLELPIGTVKSRLARAQERFDALMGRQTAQSRTQLG